MAGMCNVAWFSMNSFRFFPSRIKNVFFFILNVMTSLEERIFDLKLFFPVVSRTCFRFLSRVEHIFLQIRKQSYEKYKINFCHKRVGVVSPINAIKVQLIFFFISNLPLFAEWVCPALMCGLTTLLLIYEYMSCWQKWNNFHFWRQHSWLPVALQFNILYFFEIFQVSLGLCCFA